jgi:hypothetical protein
LDARSRLVQFLRALPAPLESRLAQLKDEGIAERGRPDFLWYQLVTSASTLGNSRGFDGLMADPDNMHRIRYESLEPLPRLERSRIIEDVFRKAKVRMPGIKAEELAGNVDLIKQMGGLAAANERAGSLSGRKAKLAFMQQFAGIGAKYARNIWMTVYDGDFHDAIALDVRVNKVSALLGQTAGSYTEQEGYFQRIAKDAGRQAWELDRIMYWFSDDVLTAMQ